MEGTYYLRMLQQITKGGSLLLVVTVATDNEWPGVNNNNNSTSITCCNRSMVLVFKNVATNNKWRAGAWRGLWVGCNMREVLQLQYVLQEAMDSNYS